METKIIANKNKHLSVNSAVPIPMGFTDTGEAADIDRGIRDAIMGIRSSILAMGVGLAKIKAQSLYKDLNYRSMFEYINHLCDDTKMYRGSIYNWLYIGEAFIKYRNELEQIGFSDGDGPSKLSYLERALESNQKQDVFDNVKNMSLREFVSFAKTKDETDISPVGDMPVVTTRGNNIYVDAKLAIIISKKLEKRTASYFKKVLRVACEALEKGEVIQPIRLHDRREAKRFAAAAERLKIRMRTKKAKGF